MTQGFYGVKGLHPNPLKDREIVIVKVKKKKKRNKASEKERAGSSWASWQLS